MSKRYITLKYEPKIKPVCDGEIRQTIRLNGRFRAGDYVVLHGWEGKPNNSKWSWRSRWYKLNRVIRCEVHPSGILVEVSKGCFEVLVWESPEADELARLEGIIPATGVELGRVLNQYYDIPETGMKGHILRW